MKYFLIGASDNINVIGHYPQTELRNSYNPSLPNSHRQVHPHNFPEFDPNLELTLHEKAIPTDFIEKSGASFGMIINAKFKNIIEQFNLPPHRFYPIKVFQKGHLLDYYWFHYVVDDFWKYLDKENSKAVIFDDNKNFEAIQNLSLDLDPEEYKNLEYFELPYNQHLRWEQISFKPDFPNYDLYQTKSFGLDTFLSHKLITALEDAGITGFETKPYDKIICES